MGIEKQPPEEQENPHQSNKRLDLIGYSATEAARQLERSQIAKYYTKAGHGFSAEDANAFSDQVRMREVEITGTSNELFGPDRIVDGIKIQTKYYNTAKDTVNAAFHLDTGLYKYSGQLLEVPADQYQESIRIMENKIRDGKVPGITDPQEAQLLVREGTVTYQQARNIARAGNIDSLKFDAKTQAVTSGYMFAISFSVSYARAKWEGKSDNDAISDALEVALATGTSTYITGIMTAQVLRTRVAAMGVVTMRNGVKAVYKTPLGKTAVEKLAQASLGKTVYGAAATNHVAKLLRSNVITSTVATVVIMTPDFYRAALARNISWAQFGKNLVVNTSGVVGGVGGWMGGAALGTAIGGPIGGVFGGIVGALAGGSASSRGVKVVADQFMEDDAQKMLSIVQNITEELSFEYLLNETELQIFADEIKTCLDATWLRRMFKAGNSGDRQQLCAEFAREQLEPMCEGIIKERVRICLPEPNLVFHEMDEIVGELEPLTA